MGELAAVLEETHGPSTLIHATAPTKVICISLFLLGDPAIVDVVGGLVANWAAGMMQDRWKNSYRLTPG